MSNLISNKIQITIKRCVVYIWGIAMVICLAGCQDTMEEERTEQAEVEVMPSRAVMADIGSEEEAESVFSVETGFAERKKTAMEEFADKEYPDVPEPFWEVLRQYEQILKVTEGLDWEDAWNEFWNDDWQYVYDLLYGAGRYDNIYYSLHDFTGDGFPEIIMGKVFEGEYCPYLIYYYDGDEVWMECECERYSLAFYEGNIVEVVGPANIMYLQFKPDTKKWETIEYLEIQYEINEIRYVREDIDGNIYESAFKEISKEEYQQIIQQYATTSIELEWTVLWEVVG